MNITEWKQLSTIARKQHIAPLIANAIGGKVDNTSSRTLINVQGILCHITTTANDKPNHKFCVTDGDNTQTFLHDVDAVIYVWPTKDQRILYMTVPMQNVLGHNTLSKDEIRSLKINNDHTLNGVINTIPPSR